VLGDEDLAVEPGGERHSGAGSGGRPGIGGHGAAGWRTVSHARARLRAPGSHGPHPRLAARSRVEAFAAAASESRGEGSVTGPGSVSSWRGRAIGTVVRRGVAGALVGGVLVLLVGCGDGSTSTPATELDNHDETDEADVEDEILAAYEAAWSDLIRSGSP